MGRFGSGTSRVAEVGGKLVHVLRQVPIARSTWLVAGVTFGLGWLPVFSRPGYESALLFGIILPPITAAATALLTRSIETTGERRLVVALRRAAAHAIVLLTVLSLHALRKGWCAPRQDLTLLLLGPISGTFMAAFWGVAAGILSSISESWRSKRWFAAALGVVGPLTSIGLGVATFYSSPVVFAFDPFVGFFAGSPYDTGFDPTLRLLSYRAGSIGLWLFLWALSRHLGFTVDGHLSLNRLMARDNDRHWRVSDRCDRAACLLGILGLVLFAAITNLGEPLGHRSSATFIRQTLGHSSRLGRCEIIHGAAQKQRQIQRLAEDCNGWLTRLERRLGTGHLAHVTVYVFDSVNQKELLMGAAHTQIAKPWRGEIYLNGANYPDDVVGHELAHVVAGLTARGPFKIAGSFGGWLPNPGLIEGMAVALAPDEDGDLTELEWSAALHRIGKLPRLHQLFSLDFLEHSGPLAYTVAGAFVDWFGKHFGKRAVRRWYAGESPEAASGQPFATLEQAFITGLDQVALPEGAIDAARAKFARLGVYSRRCPHAVDRALADGEERLAAGDATAACDRYEAAQRLDPSELRARFGLGECAERAALRGEMSETALSVYRNIAVDPSLPTAVRQRATEKEADLRLRFGALPEARALYEKLLAQTFDVDRRRSLEVRLAARSDQGIRAVQALMLGSDGEVAWDLAVRELLRWSDESPNDGLPDYLLGRNFWQKGRESAALEHLELALRRGLSLPNINAEALRQRAIMACAVGDKAKAIEIANRVAAEPHLPTPKRLGVLRLVERCAAKLAEDDWPEVAPDGDRGTPLPVATAPKTAASHQQPNFDSDTFECPPGMQKIQGGEFWVGSKRGTQSPDETPRFATRLRGFCLDRTEVTVNAYSQCISAGACTPTLGSSASCNGQHQDRGNHPINCVTHDQAARYCATQSARLPSEIEWEYAARGGSKALKYPWGDASPDGRACWKTNHSCPVKTYESGAFGLYDMSGNVWEWTASVYGEYPWGTPFPGDARTMVYRGGGWSRRFAKWMHLGLRNRLVPSGQGAHLGFRCAKDVAELECPFGSNPDVTCALGVLDAECPRGQSFNGHRCATQGEADCLRGFHVERGEGCRRDVPLVINSAPTAVENVQSQRSPTFDADCRLNQPTRPNAYRYSGASHEARNLAARRAGCKNRDVGVGWNSTCCP